MTLGLLLVLIGEPHRTAIAWVDADSACSCDKDTADARVGYAWATYGLRQFVSRAAQLAAFADVQARCQTACDAIP